MYQDGVKWMQDQGMHFFFEVSAKEGDNIELVERMVYISD